MRKRKLGRTGYEVSEIGVGGWCLSGASWRGVDVRDAQRSLYTALDSGVTFVDTAPVYGDSEVLVGEVVRDLRARDWAVVATKVSPADKTWPADGTRRIERVFPREYVIRSVEASLRSLRAEALCIAQLHVWHDAWLESSAWQDLRGTMRELVRAGKVLHWGVSINAHDPGSALGVLDDPLIETVQAVYNIFDPTAEAELFARARERDIGIIARAPFDEGVLTGVLTPDTVFPEGDVRARYLAGERLGQAVERVDALRPLLGDEARTLPELALRFCLSQPELGTVIAGMRRMEHVRENLAVSDGRVLTPALRERLREHAWARSWYITDQAA